MDRSILHAHGHNSDASPVVHQKIHHKIFDKKFAVVTEGLTIKGVEHGVAGSVGSGTATTSLKRVRRRREESREGKGRETREGGRREKAGKG
jgi:hypothetical protein